MSNNIGNNLNIINNNLVNGATLGLGGTVRSRLTLNPDYFTFSAISAGELTLDFDSPYTFDWDEYKLTILDASNNNVLNEPVIIRSDRTITANLPKGGLYTLMVEAALPQYPLPNADYGITATSFVRVKPTVSIQPLNTLISEGTVSNGGPMEYTQFTFKIILSDPPDTAETVSYSIYGISDLIDINDFEPASPFSGRSISTAKSASVSFAKNQTEQTIIVAVAKDSLEEANEQFRVQLNNPSSGIKLADIDSEVAVILNDDFTSYASIANITAGGVLEGTGTGFTTHRFEVTLNKPTLSEQTLDYMIVFGTDGADKSDFSPQAPTSQAAKVIFAPGASKATIDVEIAKDSILEAFESYAVRLSNPSTQLALGTAEAQGLIVNDDMGLLVSWNSETQRAPNEGKSLTFRVKTNQSMTSDQRIEWRIDGTTKLDGVTYSAASSADFKASSGSFIFPKNKKEASFTVETLNDDLVEGPELAKVLLTLPSGLTMDPNGNEKYIIVADNNTHPEITISQKNINEGTRATPTNFVIDLATSKAVSYIQTFNWALEATGDSPASQDDFVGNAFPSGTIIIPANSKKVSISIPIVADPYAELSDNFNLVITGSNGFTTKIFPLEITNDDGVIGTKNKDTLYGKKNDDLINGLDGNDTIYSNEVKGNYVIGGNGDDIIIDGGENLVRCDAGNDTVSLFYPTDGGGRINGGAGTDLLSLTNNIYQLNTATGVVNAVDNNIHQLNTSTGLVNAVDPGTKTFSIQFSEFEKYSMSASNMTVNGSSRDEFFQYKPSLSGNNTAVFTGGGGSDTFNLSNVIGSSERANAIFTINDLSLLNDKITIAGAGKGQFLQVKEFSNKARQMIIETKLNESTVYIDSNGDRTADITINLIGTFNASDLLKFITAS